VYLDWVITQYSPQRSQSFLIPGVWQDDRNQVFWLHMPPTYATATLRRRLKNLVSVGSPLPFSVFAKLQLILSPRSRRLCGKIEMWVVVRFGHIDQARYNQKWNNLRGGFARHAIRQIGRLSSAKPAQWR
jgi:hypothetical protein